VGAPLRTIRRRGQAEAGFGMVELVCAMAMMSIGILAVAAMFASGMTQLKNAGSVTTASALADSEMENYRAIKFEAIGLGQTAVTGADSTYKADSAYMAVSNPLNQIGSTVVVNPCPATPCTNAVPTKTVTGADGRSYRVDTYVTWHTSSNSSGATGRDLKRVTIVVRTTTPSKTWARVVSSFDESTGT
jgi:type II secretory pathway pseudopilin PulG